MNYRYQKTARINELLIELKALRIVFDRLPTLPRIEEHLLRESILRSSLYSARVEGNTLTIEQARGILTNQSNTNLKKLEVSNLLKAYRHIYFGKIPKKLSLTFISKLHQLVMHNIVPQAGKLRKEPWAIFNQADIAIYLAPPYSELPKLMGKFINQANSRTDDPLINAGFSQFIFEKIHPFADGNGRVGRLISSYILKNKGYHFRGLVSFEQYIDEHREMYYYGLEPNADGTEFIEFFLESLANQANLFLDQLKNLPVDVPEDNLLPRRQEILAIIKDHPYCSFDFITRRFASVNPKTLHYDLLVLQKSGLVKKLGKTKGSVYQAGNE